MKETQNQLDQNVSPEKIHLRIDRSEFPALGRKLGDRHLGYFDGPGGTQVSARVIRAIQNYYERCNANTHGQFVTSQESDLIVDGAREAMASFLNAGSPQQISFGANMTTLNFFLSWALGRELCPGDEVVITQLDHEANRGPWLRLRETGAQIREINLLPTGLLDYEDARLKINAKTRLVAVSYASNALGTVNDLELIRDLTRKVGALLIVDAVHYAPHFSLDMRSLDPDFLLCSAYKFYGPHVGILYTRENLLGQLQTDRLKTQNAAAPYRIETGTLNHAALAGVSASIDQIASWGSEGEQRTRLVSAMEKITAHERDLAESFYESLKTLDRIRIYGPDFSHEKRAPTISFTVEDIEPAMVARFLGDRALLVWDGDFYAARPVEILGLGGSGGLVRVGMSAYTTLDEVHRLIDALRELTESR